jgi:hypothetical protein
LKPGLEIGGNVDGQNDVILCEVAGQAIDRFRDDRRDRRIGGTGPVVGGHAEDLGTKLGESLGGGHRLFEGASRQFGIAALQGVLRVAHDRGEHVVEFMGEDGGERAERRQSLKLLDLLAQLGELAFEAVELAFDVVIEVRKVGVRRRVFVLRHVVLSGALRGRRRRYRQRRNKTSKSQEIK